ncbi:hypothetical protein GOBAR_AA16221 [Gossypium barbadense]|uniref:Uncharacterized protein n=1 Tax=Gossypium barbadense TaxID=3634 RepID=A0A2P5XMA8_GOSBA|nr:hypothetical protein GOBAR_AA16221 [Gossypium barbadense]
MSPQGISSMLHMRMIECRRGFDPPQYRLARGTDQDDPKDITDDILPFMRTHLLSHRQVTDQFMRFKEFSQLVLLRNVQTILWEKIIQNCYVLLNHDQSHHDTDHHDNLFAWHCDCGTQPLPQPEYPAPPSSFPS